MSQSVDKQQQACFFNFSLHILLRPYRHNQQTSIGCFYIIELSLMFSLSPSDNRFSNKKAAESKFEEHHHTLPTDCLAVICVIYDQKAINCELSNASYLRVLDYLSGI